VRLLPWAILVIGALVAILAASLGSGPARTALTPASVELAPDAPSEDGLVGATSGDLAELVTDTAERRPNLADPSSPGAPVSRSGPVTGRVLGGPGGRTPLAGASVTVRRDRRGRVEERSAVTDAAGRFSVVLDDRGPCFVVASSEGHGTVMQVALPSLREGEDVVLPAWRELSVQLVDTRGTVAELGVLGVPPALEPALAVQVGVHGARDARGLDRPVKRGPLVPWQRRDGVQPGRFRLGAYVRPGDEVHLFVGDRVAASAPIPPGDEVQILVDAAGVREAARPVALLVRDEATDSPIPGARVAFEFDLQELHALPTDGAGHVEWESAPAVRLTARISAPGYATWVETLRPPASGPCVARLRAGWRLAGTTVPAADATVWLWELHDGEALGKPLRSVQAGSGAFDFGAIPEGMYVLCASIATARAIPSERIRTSAEVVVVRLVGGDVLDARVPWYGPDPAARRFTARKPGGTR